MEKLNKLSKDVCGILSKNNGFRCMNLPNKNKKFCVTDGYMIMNHLYVVRELKLNNRFPFSLILFLFTK